MFSLVTRMKIKRQYFRFMVKYIEYPSREPYAAIKERASGTRYFRPKTSGTILGIMPMEERL
ncbi:hypothetical protein J2TS4_25160 [Paenibacillus sp. J2TS4]|nr:hypothetical protein J2TS4_25160 [Paenibacillus sp. J2TS4]